MKKRHQANWMPDQGWRLLRALREGDTLVVWKLDRLERDLRHLINTVHDLEGRNVGFKVLSGVNV